MTDNQEKLKQDVKLDAQDQNKQIFPKTLKGLLLMDERRFDMNIPPRGKAKRRPLINLE